MGYDLDKNEIVWDKDSVIDCLRDDMDTSQLTDDDIANIIDICWERCDLWEITHEAAEFLGFDVY